MEDVIMRRSHWLWLAALLGAGALAGCGKSDANVRTYDIKGKVVAIAPDKKAVTLDHEAIPGLMNAMKMEFPVEGPHVLEGIAADDLVEGKLKVTADKQTVTELHKVAPGAAGTSTGLDGQVRAARATLGAEDQQLVAAQDYCAVRSKNRLGSMGAPFKLLIEGQPVFLCCDGCQEQALADAEKTLARVKELKDRSKAGTK
jgi:Cu/Ag efflux protein CusF